MALKTYGLGSLVRRREPNLSDAKLGKAWNFGFDVFPPAQAVVQGIPSEKLDLDIYWLGPTGEGEEKIP